MNQKRLVKDDEFKRSRFWTNLSSITLNLNSINEIKNKSFYDSFEK